MIEFYPKTSILNYKKDPNITNRSLISQDQPLLNSQIIPWSGDEYEKKLKQQIKKKQYRKRSETSQGLYEHFRQSKKKEIAKRVNTVNIQINSVNLKQQKFHWNTILPKKLSNKVIPKEIIFPQKPQQVVKNERQSEVSKMHEELLRQRKLSKKQMPCIKNRSQRLHSEAIYNQLKSWREQKYKINHPDNKKNCLFFFEVKNSTNVSHREKMISKLRNFERGKAEKSLLTNNY